MSNNTKLTANLRQVSGKKVKQLRTQGLLPATIYQKGKPSVSVEVDYQGFVKAFNEAGYGQPIEINVAGETRLAMIKDVQIDPARNTYSHIAFHAVRADRIVEAEIPVEIVGEVPAEKAGNFLVNPNTTVLVKATPANLPEVLKVSAETLVEPGDSLTVEDLTLPADVEMVSEPNMPLVMVEAPREEEEPEVEEEVDAEDVPSDHGDSEDQQEADSKSEASESEK